MRLRGFLVWCMLIVVGVNALRPPQAVKAAPFNQASAYDLIIAMNTVRVSNGLPPLIEDPIIDAVAQSTAAIMAANNMSWHIGDVRGRLAAAGYGGGGTVWATENFAVSSGGMGIDEIMAVWADPDHMRPAVNPAYCHVGAGTAQSSDGRIYYILQAAYVSEHECGSTLYPPGGTPGTSGPLGVSQLIVPVKIATPDAEGKIFHIVQAGQSYWSIAIAYQITIRDLEVWNNLSRTIPLRTGQSLFIPGKNTQGYATPTPFGMFAIQTPDADGRIIHTVEPYQALISIAEAYRVPVDRILALNGLQADWPLRIGQKLVISPGNITPSPTLNSLQKLTPGADGKYYHLVRSGETLSWIADLYDIPLSSLMAWNGLDTASVIRPEQRLLLLVTPPATATLTPRPATVTPSPAPSMTRPSPTSTEVPAVAEETPRRSYPGLMIIGVTIPLLVGLLLWWRSSLKKSRDVS
ncbi:MAG: LysM peptidoglycan-binding domain-containing protein [Bacteroidota bacterium]